MGEGWERVGEGWETVERGLGEGGRRLGEGWERVGEGWERVGEGWERVGEGWERVGEDWERVGEGWERVGEGWERVGESGGGLGEGRAVSTIYYVRCLLSACFYPADMPLPVVRSPLGLPLGGPGLLPGPPALPGCWPEAYIIQYCGSFSNVRTLIDTYTSGA